MPAVRNFSLCACLAVLVDFGLQVTAFVALLAMDTARIEQRRLDLLTCVVLPEPGSGGRRRRRRQQDDGDAKAGSELSSAAAPRARSYGGTLDPLVERELDSEPLLQVIEFYKASSHALCAWDR